MKYRGLLLPMILAAMCGDDAFVVKNGAKRVVVSYYHYSRKDKNHMSSQTDYVWETKNEEMFKYFEARRTKVFYS